MEIGVLSSTAYARSVRRSPACMHEDACATRQYCIVNDVNGRRYTTLATNAVSVHKCPAPASRNWYIRCWMTLQTLWSTG